MTKTVQLFLISCLAIFALTVKAAPVGEILDLGYGSVVPSSIYTTYNSRQIGQTIALRVHKYQDEKRIKANSQPEFNFMRDSKIMLQFPAMYIDSISSKCFLNQHQTGSSRAINHGLTRADAENALSGLQLESNYLTGIDNPVNRVRPKYAYVTILNKKSYMKQTTYSSGFGEVFAVLKDEIKNQSTFTEGDSLQWFVFQKEVTSRSFYVSTSRKIKGASPYWEAQIWGEVCFSDVEYFLIDCPNMKAATQESKDKLKNSNIPVYQCIQDSTGGMAAGPRI